MTNTYNSAKMNNDFIKHTVLESEKEAFTEHINEVLKDDQDMKSRIPIKPDTIFDNVQDGIIFCKLINASIAQKIPPISPQAINLSPSNTYHKIENLNLAICSAKAIGCTVINIRPEFIMEKRQHIVLGLIWQIIRIHLSNHINLKKHPQIIVLKKEGEHDQDFRKLGYEEILIRWLHYHVNKNGGNRVIRNLGTDLSDSQAYGHVLTNVANLNIAFWGKDKVQRSQQIIQTCRKQKIHTKMHPQDIISSNTHLNTMLCVDIFNQKHGLQQQAPSSPPQLNQPQVPQSKQIRVFKNWINSQGIEQVNVTNLMHDLRDGRILLKVLDNFKPNLVDWQNKYSNKLSSRIHIVHNCNYVLELCGQLGVKIVAVDGIDIVDGRASLTLGLLWQICRMYWESRVGFINDEELVGWGNSKVPQKVQIKSLKDPSVQNCQFLLHIIQSIKKGTVNFSKLKKEKTEDAKISNINYTIASARKLGAEIITLWEHILEGNSLYLAILLAELRYLDTKFRKN